MDTEPPSSVVHNTSACRDYKEGERSIPYSAYWQNFKYREALSIGARGVTCESCRALLVKAAVLSLDEDRLK